AKYVHEDAAKLEDFHKRLTVVSSDLGIVLAANTKLDMNLLMERKFEQLANTLSVIGLDEDMIAKMSLQNVQQVLEKAATSATNIEKLNDQELLVAQAEEAPVAAPTKRNAVVNEGKADVRFLELRRIMFSELEFDEFTAVKLGQGGYGEVFKCIYKKKPAALKRFPALSKQQQRSFDSKVLRSIKREALIMQHIDHRNILKFYGGSIEHGRLLMELAACSLHDVLHNGGKIVEDRETAAVQWNLELLSFEWKAQVLYDISKALRYIHALNIIHCDLKPDNVMLCLDPSNPQKVVAKLGDFGLAKAVDIVSATAGTNGMDTKTRTKATAAESAVLPGQQKKAAGTSHYMAPELFDGQKHSAASDVFAFGVIVCEVSSLFGCCFPGSS
ncbi:serine/threonine-protein kinase, partial [archaeon]